MNPNDKPSTYQAYLIRVWRAHASGPWRISVQPSLSDERLGFPDLASAFLFLQGKLSHPEGYLKEVSMVTDETLR